MTNSHTKAVVLSVFALAVAFTSCKKDKNETAASFRLETSSLDFEWGQSKDLPFTTNRIVTVGVPTDLPDGWRCTLGDGKFTITAPAEGGQGDATGTIKFSATTEGSTEITRELTVAVLIAEEIVGAANSFIVGEPGKRYKFNALRRGNETAATITGAASATRLWSTSNTAISNVSLEDNGYIYFRSGGTDEIVEGNALIALMDSDKKILWSWHVWITDYDPAADPDVLGGLSVMNRNLGAFAASNATPEDAVRSYGLYYQWGRKDPFVGPILWDSTTPQTLYGNSGSYVTNNYVVSNVDNDTKDEYDYPGTAEYAVSHPAAFIAGNEDNNFDWLIVSNKGLWSATSKTIYDPCPAGWRVAPASVWKSFTTTGGASSDPTEFNVEGEYNYGWTFLTDQPSATEDAGDLRTTFFPAAGRRSFSPSLASTADNFTNVVNDGEGVGYPVGFYWSSDYPVPSDATVVPNGAALAFRRDYINPAHTVSETAFRAPAGGFPLRCVAE